MTGAGKKLVDKTVGEKIDRAVNKRDKVELSEESKERIKRGDLDRKRESESEKEKIDEKLLDMYRPRVIDGQYKKGGKVSASSRADGIAKRGKTRGRMY